MNKSLDFDPCGIEVSARTLVVRRRRPGQSDTVRVCLEATGLYGLDLALRLEAAGVALMVANPRAVRHFARAMM